MTFISWKHDVMIIFDFSTPGSPELYLLIVGLDLALRAG